MNMPDWTIFRPIVIGLTLVLSQTACAQSEAPATAPTEAPAASTAAPAAQVTGLPDFTGLVERNAPAVVNIRAVTMAGSRGAGAGRQPSPHDDIPEFFRRFFGPDIYGPPGGRDRESGGSGFIISQDGYVLTNNHVVQGADEVTVRLADRRQLTAEVVGTDPQTDIALLKIDAGDLPAVRLGDSNTLKPGQWVVAIGSPFSFDHSVTAGVVSATGRSVGQGQQYVPFIQTDVAINPGNSGGPLFNLNGEVIGINSQIFSGTGGYMGISFAIPVEVAQNVVDQLKTDGRVSRGLIGVQVQEVTREIAESLGMERPAGALVSQLVSGGAAADAGMEIGDVIVSFNGRTVESSNDLPPLVGSTRPGTQVELVVFRDGRERTLNVTVGEAEADPEAVTASSSPSAPASGANLLGLTVQDVPAEHRERLGLDEGQGVLVTRIGGAAARAQLSRGDVILRVGRTPIDNVRTFENAVKDVKPGDSVMLLVRNQRQANAFVTVTVRESDG